MPACRKPHSCSFPMTPEGYKDTLLLAQRVGKKINLVKKHHGFSCDSNSKKGFSSCCTEKATCREDHELSGSLCSLEKPLFTCKWRQKKDRAPTPVPALSPTPWGPVAACY